MPKVQERAAKTQQVKLESQLRPKVEVDQPIVQIAATNVELARRQVEAEFAHQQLREERVRNEIQHEAKVERDAMLITKERPKPAAEKPKPQLEKRRQIIARPFVEIKKKLASKTELSVKKVEPMQIKKPIVESIDNNKNDVVPDALQKAGAIVGALYEWLRPEIPIIETVAAAEMLEPAGEQMIVEFANELAQPKLTVESLFQQPDDTETEMLPEVITLENFVIEMRTLLEVQTEETDTQQEFVDDEVSQEVVEHIEDLLLNAPDSPEAVEVQTRIGKIMVAAQEVNKLLKPGDEVALVKAKEEFKDLCVKLLEDWGIKFDDEKLERFMQRMLQVNESFVEKIAIERETSTKRGTHESKTDGDITNALDWDAEMESLLSAWLGRASMHASPVLLIV